MKLFLATVAALGLACPTLAGRPGAELRRTTPCCWETLFRQGTVDCPPAGRTRGAVLYADGKHPYAKARLQGAVWKGKDFHCNGTLTNRWLGGIRAVSTDVHVETSWLDGQPCFVMQYAPDDPVLGNVRDEVRQIGPDEWLGRGYDAATGCPKNWFVLRGK